MGVREDQVLEALGQVPFPGFKRDVVSAGVVRGVTVEGERVRVTVDPGPDPTTARVLESAVREAVGALAGVTSVDVVIAGQPSEGLRMAGAPRPTSAAEGSLDPGLIPHVRHVIAVASGKGGVGKSTVAVNLAVALGRSGLKTGLLDADIYGPSIPLMMGETDNYRLTPDGNRLVPFERHGVSFMSLGFLVPPDSAVIWRGPMVMKAVEQLLRDVDWGALDVLVVDMPPGTGDAQLTLSQRVSLAGAVIVTTPQDVALADAIKGVNMFRKVGVPVLGLVENMSGFACPHCGERSDIFGRGGGRREAERMDAPFLGEIPLDPEIREGGDSGAPLVAGRPDSPQTAAFVKIAGAIRDALTDEAADGAPPDGGGLLKRFRKQFL